MKTSTIAKVDPRRLSALRANPELVKLRTLMNKVSSGAATSQERAEYDALTKRARELDPNVLVD